MHVNLTKFSNYRQNVFGQTLSWFNSDSRENFIQNIKSSIDELKKNDWINTSIVYKFNSDGFRCDEFSSDDNIVFLGCSITAGVGLNQKDLYTTKVAESLKLKCHNLGVAGSGNDTAFRMALAYLEKLKPKIVVLHHLYIGRIEVLDIDKAIFLLPHTDPKKFPDLYKIWLGTEENLYLNQTKNSLAIRSLASSIGAKFIHTAGLAEPEIPFGTLARDLKHPGYKYHTDLSKSILDAIS
jgi:hypothetical protein